jgi:hypothetical protein
MVFIKTRAKKSLIFEDPRLNPDETYFLIIMKHLTEEFSFIILHLNEDNTRGVAMTFPE